MSISSTLPVARFEVVSEVTRIMDRVQRGEAMSRGLGLGEAPPRYHDLDELAGTWQEDPAFDAAITAQDQVDPRLWK